MGGVTVETSAPTVPVALEAPEGVELVYLARRRRSAAPE